MDADVSKLTEYIKGNTKRFIIPQYQREYSWKMKECETLLFDLLYSCKNNYSNHFFGSIVFYAEAKGRIINNYLIDGQQRISTIFIMLMAIKKLAEDNKYDGIDIDYLNKEYLLDDTTIKLKLKMIESDDNSLRRIVDNAYKKNESQLASNYYYFYSKFSEMSENELFSVIKAIEGLQVVLISLDPKKGDIPQLIFESLNSKGVKLSEADKIRNYVLMNQTPEELDRLYKQYWEPLEAKVGKDDLGKFFRYYVAKHTYSLCKEDSLYTSFKEFRDAFYKEIEELFSDMMIYANYYGEITNAKRDAKGYQGSIGRLIYLDVNTSIPLIFDFYDAYKTKLINEKDFDEIMDILETYYVRRMFCTESISSLNKTFVSMGKDIRKIIENKKSSYLDAFKYTVLIRTGKTRFPKDAEFYDKFASFELYNSKPEFRKYIFERLENYKVKVQDQVINNIDNKVYTIEHIMPQTLSKEWKKYLGPNWDTIHSKYLNTIGNLTITEYNSEYSNQLYEVKRDLPDKGFKCSKIHINKDLATYEKWSEDSIKERATNLLKIAKDIWKYPSTSFVFEDEIAIFTLGDEIDLDKYSFSTYRLLGEETEVSGFDEAFKKLCFNLYALDTVKFSSNKDLMQSSSSKKFKKQIEINDNLYVSLDGNIKDKLNYLINQVQHLGLEQDDVEFGLKAKVQFDILNEETYSSAKAGEFAKAAFEYLLNKEILQESEIQLLLDTQWTRDSFPGAVYAALSTEREKSATRKTDEKGKTRITWRYYDEPVNYKGTKLYISSQWYPYTKDGIVSYFKKQISKKNNDD